jgi:hypothetical protein
VYLKQQSIGRSISVALAEAMGVSMIKLLTCWMEKDPAKDPFMDNCIRAVCLAFFGWMAYHFIVALIERFSS